MLTPYSNAVGYRSEEGGNRALRNVGILTNQYTVP